MVVLVVIVVVVVLFVCICLAAIRFHIASVSEEKYCLDENMFKLVCMHLNFFYTWDTQQKLAYSARIENPRVLKRQRHDAQQADPQRVKNVKTTSLVNHQTRSDKPIPRITQGLYIAFGRSQLR